MPWVRFPHGVLSFCFFFLQMFWLLMLRDAKLDL